MGYYQNSATAASNTTVNGIGSAGSSSANLIDDLIRELAAQGRQFANDLGGNNTVGGTADAITITPSSGSVSSIYDGLFVGFIAGSDNTTTTPTANVGGLGAEPIKKAVAGVETAVVAGDIQAGGFYWLRWRAAWDSTNGAWELVNPDHLPAARTVVSEGGAATVQLAQAIAKAWANLNGTGTVALRDSYNVASITDSGTGLYALGLTNAFSSTNYSSYGSSFNTGLGFSHSHWRVSSASQVNVNTGNNSGTYTDIAEIAGSCHGDLA